MAHQLDPGPAHVTAEVMPRINGISALDRVQEQTVLSIHHPPTLRPNHLHETTPVVLRTVPQPHDAGVELVNAASGVRQQVEFPVELEELRDVGVLLDARLEFLQSRMLFDREDIDTLLQSQRLQALTHSIQHAHLVHVQQWYTRTAVHGDLSQTLEFEHPKRFTHRHTAGAQPGGDLFLTDALTRLDVPTENLISKVGGDLLTGGQPLALHQILRHQFTVRLPLHMYAKGLHTLESMQSGRRNPATLTDVAQAAGVHPSTVSRALDPAREHLVSPETQIRIVQVAESLGYQKNTVARSLRTGSSGLVGVVCPDVANPFIAQFLRGAEEVLQNAGQMLLIAESHDEPGTLKEVVQQMVTRRLDALIVTAARRGDEAALGRAAESLPVVLAVRSLEFGDLPTIAHDDRLGARMATEHLIGLGHHRLAQIRGSEDISSFRHRANGFADLLARSSARDVSLPELAVEPNVEQGQKLANELLDLPDDERPTAIFAHNDLLAVGTLAAINARGLHCPQDVSVIGYNDSPLTDYLSPPLTTVRVPTAELGHRAGRTVVDLLAGAEVPAAAPLPPDLIIRQSTAAPR